MSPSGDEVTTMAKRQLFMAPTLWNSFDWLEAAPPSWQESARNGLLDTLQRKGFNPNDAVKRGMAFEDALINEKKNKFRIDPSVQDKYDEFYDIIHQEGNEYQRVAKYYFTMDDRPFLMYGREDVFVPSVPHIIDIKTTGNYKGPKNYLKGWQHKVYCLAEHISTFDYIVYEFSKIGHVVGIHKIPYVVEDWDELEADVKGNADKVIKIIRADPEFKEAFMNTYNKKF